ncbi:MAG: hypothetical protein OEW58_02070 [Gammaproteobacteria bacterium]|nr:hypothetical protein [Gammaproteobacteria bacterium]
MSIKVRFCEFSFKCPKLWQNLDETDDPAVRYCNSCQQQVYLCVGREELRDALNKGYCVALPDEDNYVLGELASVDFDNIDNGKPLSDDRRRALRELVEADKQYRASSKPQHCPRCNHSPVARIIYGYPDITAFSQDEIERGEITFGGCELFDDQPHWRCTSCGCDIYFKKRSKT